MKISKNEKSSSFFWVFFFCWGGGGNKKKFSSFLKNGSTLHFEAIQNQEVKKILVMLDFKSVILQVYSLASLAAPKVARAGSEILP